MLEFKTREELQNCEELQNMGRFEWEKVLLDGKEVFACTTDQQYEDIIWGGLFELLEDLNQYYRTEIDSSGLAADIRDVILERLEKDYGIEFVDVFDEY